MIYSIINQENKKRSIEGNAFLFLRGFKIENVFHDFGNLLVWLWKIFKLLLKDFLRTRLMVISF